MEDEDRIRRCKVHGARHKVQRGRSKEKDATRRTAQGPEIQTVNLVPCAVCHFAEEQIFSLMKNS